MRNESKPCSAYQKAVINTLEKAKIKIFGKEMVCLMILDEIPINCAGILSLEFYESTEAILKNIDWKSMINLSSLKILGLRAIKGFVRLPPNSRKVCSTRVINN